MNHDHLAVLPQVDGQLCRMPTYFPNYELSMFPLTPQQARC